MKTILALLAATLSMTLFVQPSASQKPAITQSVLENTKLINYLGIKNEMLVFKVNLNSYDNDIKMLNILTIQRFNVSTNHRFNKSTNQQINKSTNQQINDSTNQQFNHSIPSNSQRHTTFTK